MQGFEITQYQHDGLNLNMEKNNVQTCNIIGVLNDTDLCFFYVFYINVSEN